MECDSDRLRLRLKHEASCNPTDDQYDSPCGGNPSSPKPEANRTNLRRSVAKRLV